MAANSVAIANAALAHVGTRRITSLSDPSKEGRCCNDHYTESKNAVLRLHPWNFAIKRTVLEMGDIDDVADDGSGLIEVTTSAAHGLATGDKVTIENVEGTTEANVDSNVITVTSATTFTLDDSTFANAYTDNGNWVKAPTFGFRCQFALPADFIRVAKVLDDTDCELGQSEFKVESGYILTNLSTLWLKYVWEITDTTKFDKLFDELLALYLASKIVYKITGSETSRDMVNQLLKRALRQARFTDSIEDPSESLDVDEWNRARWDNNSGYVRDPGT